MKDTINKGVINKLGLRVSPPFRHHVDDNLYADTRKYFILKISVSLLSLYCILGILDGQQLDPFSFQRLITHFMQMKKCIGKIVDSKKLIIYSPKYKRDLLMEQISIFF